MTARILDITPETYHLDPLPTPSLSSSIAHTLISQSPLHAWLRHPKLGGTASLATAATDTGHLVHELLLGAGRGLVVIDAEDFRTKAAKDARDLARDAGQVPVLRSDFEAANVAVTALGGKLKELGVVLSGESEIAVTWEEHPTPTQSVVCRGLMDHVILDRGKIYDLKTIRSANPKVCARHMIEYGYAIQYAAYTSAIEQLRPDLAGRTDFVFLFAEVEPPYCITAARPSGTMRELGRAQWDRAVATWANCLQWDKWPSYTSGIIELEPPPWALAAEMGSAA